MHWLQSQRADHHSGLYFYRLEAGDKIVTEGLFSQPMEVVINKILERLAGTQYMTVKSPITVG